MHTSVETPLFVRSASRAGITEEELDEIRTYLAQHPDTGDEMPGTRGARKLRFAARGRGKRGGYRVVTFYSGQDIPVFLLDIYATPREKGLISPSRKRTRSEPFWVGLSKNTGGGYEQGRQTTD